MRPTDLPIAILALAWYWWVMIGSAVGYFLLWGWSLLAAGKTDNYDQWNGTDGS